MAAAATDKFKKVQRKFSTTLSSQLAQGATTLTPATVTGLPTDTGITVSIDRVDSNGDSTPSLHEEMTGVVSGSTIASLVRGKEGTTDQVHAAGAVVEILWTETVWNDAVDGILVEHNQDGTHSDITATTVTTTGDATVGNDLTVDNDLTVTGVVGALSGTSFTASGNIETTAGAVVTDTISEESAANGVVVDGVTLKDGIVQPRESTTASATSITPNADSYDFYTVTALAAGLTINAPTGSPVNGQKMIIRLLDDGTGRALTWNAIWRAVGVDLPTTTVASKTVYVGALYNSADTKWDVIVVNEEE